MIANTWTVGSYFEALGIPLKRGRFFTDADGRSGQAVIIVSEMLARKLWPDRDGVGRQIEWGVPQSTAPWMTVVGVVGDVKQGPIDSEIIMQTYEPLAQAIGDAAAGRILGFFSNVNLIVRSDREPASIAAESGARSNGWMRPCRCRRCSPTSSRSRRTRSASASRSARRPLTCCGWCCAAR